MTPVTEPLNQRWAREGYFKSTTVFLSSLSFLLTLEI
jgi:hypothetical protein